MEFNCFWSLYPRRVAKAAARKAWDRVPQHHSIILSVLPAHIASWTERGEPQFIPHPASWLNGERWDDELECQIKAAPKLASVGDLVSYAKLRGMEARPGESAEEFRRRLKA